jgi:hypothetical protein
LNHRGYDAWGQGEDAGGVGQFETASDTVRIANYRRVTVKLGEPLPNLRLSPRPFRHFKPHCSEDAQKTMQEHYAPEVEGA